MNFKKKLKKTSPSSSDRTQPLLDKLNSSENLKIQKQEKVIPLLGEINFDIKIENENAYRDYMVDEIEKLMQKQPDRIPQKYD